MMQKKHLIAVCVQEQVMNTHVDQTKHGGSHESQLKEIKPVFYYHYSYL